MNVTVTRGEGVKKSDNFEDVIYGRPLNQTSSAGDLISLLQRERSVHPSTSLV